MQVLINELPPQHIWQRHIHGTSLVDYPIRRHSVTQSNPDADETYWIPEPAFHEYSKSDIEGPSSTLITKIRKRIEAAIGIASDEDNPAPVRSRASNLRRKIGGLFGQSRGRQGHDRVEEPLELTRPTGFGSLMLWPIRRLRQKFGHRKESVDLEVEHEHPDEERARAKGKERESEPACESESSLDE